MFTKLPSIIRVKQVRFFGDPMECRYVIGNTKCGMHTCRCDYSSDSFTLLKHLDIRKGPKTGLHRRVKYLPYAGTLYICSQYKTLSIKEQSKHNPDTVTVIDILKIHLLLKHGMYRYVSVEVVALY